MSSPLGECKANNQPGDKEEERVVFLAVSKVSSGVCLQVSVFSEQRKPGVFIGETCSYRKDSSLHIEISTFLSVVIGGGNHMFKKKKNDHQDFLWVENLVL